MKAKAVRLYGKKDLRLEDIELRDIRDDEILAQVMTDSICMSTYKEVIQGAQHKRVPEDIATNPIIIGHEFAGNILKVGSALKNAYQEGQAFTLQPNINHKGLGYAPGYSFTDFGGDATHIIIPGEVMAKGFLLKYNGDSFFKASLAEPLSCLIAAFAASYHMAGDGKTHVMGIKPGGNMAILAGCGPMGLGAIDLVLNMDPKPKRLVVTDIADGRISRAKEILSPEKAKAAGIELTYVNTSGMDNVNENLSVLTEGAGFDDILVMAPVSAVVEQADAIAGKDCCINFFSGPTDTQFSARVNFYDVHYTGKHIIGTSGGNTDDMREALRLIEQGLNPAVMVTHIGGLNAAAEATLNLPSIPGGKKLIYTNIEMDLVAIDDFAEKGKTDPLFSELHAIAERYAMLWSAEAEKYLLDHAKRII
jgi:threonine dehydrogenase-like Zn-dependent dehydrogenase